MATETLFTPLPATGVQPRPMVTIDFNETTLTVPAGATLAAGLLAAGVRRFRSSPVGGGARAPYCMMGVCFECLLEVDGVPAVQGCMVQARDGMRVRTMDGATNLPACGVDGDNDRNSNGAGDSHA